MKVVWYVIVGGVSFVAGAALSAIALKKTCDEISEKVQYLQETCEKLEEKTDKENTK